MVKDIKVENTSFSVMLRKIRRLWRTPPKTAAITVLDEFTNIEKSRLVVALRVDHNKISSIHIVVYRVTTESG